MNKVSYCRDGLNLHSQPTLFALCNAPLTKTDRADLKALLERLTVD